MDPVFMGIRQEIIDSTELTGGRAWALANRIMALMEPVACMECSGVMCDDCGFTASASIHRGDAATIEWHPFRRNVNRCGNEP